MARWTSRTPEQVAELVLNKMYQGKFVVIPGFLPRFYQFLAKIIPQKIQLNLLAKQFVKNSK